MFYKSTFFNLYATNFVSFSIDKIKLPIINPTPMKNQLSVTAALALFIGLFMLSYCNEKKSTSQMDVNVIASEESDFNGFQTQIELGEHLVIIGGCHDCHTPKKMTNHGPVLDSTLWLSGHPSEMPLIDINRKEIESKGLSVASDLTEWVGPWGVSFSANLTPDPTGIGNWNEEQFIYCLRNGKFKGLPGSRTLLPPMPWEMIGQMTDVEMKATFAYLMSNKPINNLVPAPIPPVSIRK